ncbi:GNAT family N-acetyltransferase [Paenibacillus sp. J5C_2022]|uniref:GNAT family N-acetyltransferase n=1 Tax=Paenibacillus sp. J5C2022 TaxID=2977129 RepID=UPI0021CFFBD9|nr:GNAT family N-acetyltransferase [Paenibacillus sp. J5C2022]MCU6710828.1 GNAT family N-acetyltransferase [Paenibacillus sp. J5C2022]
MFADKTPIEIRSIDECTIRELTTIWNAAFHQDAQMARTSMQTVQYLGDRNIRTDVSVVAFQNNKAIGFVYVGWKDVLGRKLAWNGGTGVHPDFRGRDLGRMMLQEAISRMQQEGVEHFSLETRTDNVPAIRSYEKCGMAIIDTVSFMRREGAFERIPFMTRRGAADYFCLVESPEIVSRLPFYRSKSSWTTHWFNAGGGEALLALDEKGTACGYAIYRKYRDEVGRVAHVQLTHCEANTGRDDAPDIVRYMLGAVFGPADRSMMRTAKYLSSADSAALEVLREEGFKTVIQEYLMELSLPN